MKFLSKYHLRPQIAKSTLRTKILLAFIFPLIFLLSITSLLHLTREQQEWGEIYATEAIKFGDLALLGLKHAMSTNDTAMTAAILHEFGQQEFIERVWIVNNEGRVRFSSIAEEVEYLLETSEPECFECHQYPPANRPRAAKIQIEQEVLRVAVPILNEPDCQSCHSEKLSHLGVLLVDESLTDFDEYVKEDMILNILISGFSLFSTAVIGYFLLNWLVERRIKVVLNAMKAFSDGNFSLRIPKKWKTEDEVTQLADAFNQMADKLEEYNAKQQEVNTIRQQAILDEREGIARDLHDGILQVLAYLTSKIGAMRLRIQQNDQEIALQQLDQFEKAINNEVGDVRSTIAGLKLIGQQYATFAENINHIIDMCQRMYNISIETEIHPFVDKVEFDAGVELQLLRIIQEAINNTRKHASASKVKITAKLEANFLNLWIEDNGQGFNPWRRSIWQPPHFGLSSMSERAERIGAAFEVESKEGIGTKIKVKVKVKV